MSRESGTAHSLLTGLSLFVLLAEAWRTDMEDVGSLPSPEEETEGKFRK